MAPVLALRAAQERAEALAPKLAALAALAASIEGALFQETVAPAADVLAPQAPRAAEEPNAEYRDRARALISSLRHAGNSLLRARIIAGELAPSALAQQAAGSAAALAAPSVRERVERLASEGRRMAAIEGDGRGAWAAAQSEDLRCSSCGARTGKLESRVVSGARDIRKAEVWAAGGASDDVTFALRCLTCQFEWTGPEG
jgi:hypothetical protein